MEWLPSSSLVNEGCLDATDCSDNVVCYTMAYTPAVSGKLTSYTAVFRVDCDGGGTAIINNASCSMADKSQQLDGCKEIGQVQLASSGNSGTLEVVANETVYLHQLCLQTRRGRSRIGFEMDPLIGITTSIDLPDGGAVTEIVAYPKSFLPRNAAFCGGDTDGISTSSIGDIRDSEALVSLTMAPNPATDYLWVKVKAPGEEATIHILDINGRVLHRSKGAAVRTETFDLTAWPSGTYYVALGEAHGSMSEKFIISR